MSERCVKNVPRFVFVYIPPSWISCVDTLTQKDRFYNNKLPFFESLSTTNSKKSQFFFLQSSRRNNNNGTKSRPFSTYFYILIPFDFHMESIPIRKKFYYPSYRQINHDSNQVSPTHRWNVELLPNLLDVHNVQKTLNRRPNNVLC